MDLIDRQAVYKLACNGCTRHGDNIGECYHDEPCEKLIAEFTTAPTVDAVPVVHGRWDRRDDPEFILGDFECSVCEDVECDIDTSVFVPGVNCMYYCPNCGAKMDGGADGG